MARSVEGANKFEGCGRHRGYNRLDNIGRNSILFSTDGPDGAHINTVRSSLRRAGRDRRNAGEAGTVPSPTIEKASFAQGAEFLEGEGRWWPGFPEHDVLGEAGTVFAGAAGRVGRQGGCDTLQTAQIHVRGSRMCRVSSIAHMRMPSEDL